MWDVIVDVGFLRDEAAMHRDKILRRRVRSFILLISTLLGTEQHTPNLHSGGPRFGSHSEYELH